MTLRFALSVSLSLALFGCESKPETTKDEPVAKETEPDREDVAAPASAAPEAPAATPTAAKPAVVAKPPDSKSNVDGKSDVGATPTSTGKRGGGGDVDQACPCRRGLVCCSGKCLRSCV